MHATPVHRKTSDPSIGPATGSTSGPDEASLSAAAYAGTLDLVIALGAPEGRREAIRRLAHHLGAEDALLFVPDPDLAVPLPAPGLPQTLPEGRRWREFVRLCIASSRVTPVKERPGAILPHPDTGVASHVTALTSADGSVLALLGSVSVLPGYGEAYAPVVERLLPLLGRAIGAEHAVRAAAGHASVARDNAAQAGALTRTLDATRRTLEDALARAETERLQAEAATRLRDEFLAAAAHELKTPITSLMGFSQLMRLQIRRRRDVSLEQVDAFARTLDAQSRKLAQLVNRLLDVSRIQAGKLVLERQPTNLAALVQEVAGVVQHTSESHQIVVTVSGDSGVTAAAGDSGHVMAHVDPLRIEQVLTNLLENAVRFSPEGGTVEVTVEDETGTHDRTAATGGQPGETTRYARFAVRDWGVGIPEQQRPHIFDRYYQAHASGHYGGMGLGLFISKEIVVQHGGTLTVETPASSGTRFVVRLPR